MVGAGAWGCRGCGCGDVGGQRHRRRRWAGGDIGIRGSGDLGIGGEPRTGGGRRERGSKAGVSGPPFSSGARPASVLPHAPSNQRRRLGTYSSLFQLAPPPVNRTVSSFVERIKGTPKRLYSTATLLHDYSFNLYRITRDGQWALGEPSQPSPSRCPGSVVLPRAICCRSGCRR